MLLGRQKTESLFVQFLRKCDEVFRFLGLDASVLVVSDLAGPLSSIDHFAVVLG